MAAYQARFAWIWPLMLTHAVSDLTVTLTGLEAPLWLDIVANLAFVVTGILLLRGGMRSERAARGGSLWPRRATAESGGLPRGSSESGMKPS